MRIVMFYHSLLSDWNHGNAHFLRGIVSELMFRGHQVTVLEPADSWSLQNLTAEHGQKPLRKFQAAYPRLLSKRYTMANLDLDTILEDADLVIAHEWNAPELISRLGRHRANNNHYALFFHDTHHRLSTAPEAITALELHHYDGVLAYGRVLQGLYELSARVQRAWTWHEAADTRIFQPGPAQSPELDLVWIGNWGDDERAEELAEFLITPSRELGLKSRVYGVRYPEAARKALSEAGIDYGGWLPNFEAPRIFHKTRFTLHVPRRPYVKALPGIPTIRVFEALACGIPLLCSPWADVEGLFRPGTDYLVARDGKEMKRLMQLLLNEPDLRASLAKSGLETIRARHTCAHRVDELLTIYRSLKGSNSSVRNLCPTV